MRLVHAQQLAVQIDGHVFARIVTVFARVTRASRFWCASPS